MKSYRCTISQVQTQQQLCFALYLAELGVKRSNVAWNELNPITHLSLRTISIALLRLVIINVSSYAGSWLQYLLAGLPSEHNGT